MIRTRRGHIFNPAALALLLSIPLFGTGQSWWGALPDLPWPSLFVLLAGGCLVVERVNKFPLVLSFTGVYFGLFTIVALVKPEAVAEMFRPPFLQAVLFLAYFMLTDPPTSPNRYLDQLWLGALVAVLSCLAQLLGAGQSYLLVGLLLGNIALAYRRLATGVSRPSRPTVYGAFRFDRRSSRRSPAPAGDGAPDRALTAWSHLAGGRPGRLLAGDQSADRHGPSGS